MRHLRFSRTLSLLSLVLLLSIVAGGISYFHVVQVRAAASGTSPDAVLNAYLKSIHPALHYEGKATGSPQFQCQIPVDGGRCYIPSQITRAYNIDPLYKAGIDGKGQTIVIVNTNQDPTVQHDLQLFDKTFHLPDPQLNILAPYGTDPVAPSANGETSLDVQWAHAIAPKATIDLVYAKIGDPSTVKTYSDVYTSFFKAVKYAVDTNLGDVISLSYGFTEPCLTPQALAQSHQVLAAAAAKHITVLAAAGDSGASAVAVPQIGCGSDSSPYFSTPTVAQPAADPLVTSVGGTYLNTDLKGNYQSETAWTQVSFDPQTGGSNEAGGGGFSSVYPKPSYQQGIATIGKQRGLPDVAYNADLRTNVIAFCSSCGLGQDAVLNSGGTSSGTPQWAGIVALGNELGHHRLGFLNPALYRIGKSPFYKTAFHDITSGNNTYKFLDANNNVVTVPGYEAGTGWDAVTGWGTPITFHLLPLLILADRLDDGANAA